MSETDASTAGTAPTKSASNTTPVLVVSAVLCSLVMGVVVAFALRARSSSAEDGTAPLAGAASTYRVADAAGSGQGLCGDADPALPIKVRFHLDKPGVYDFGDVKQGIVEERTIGFTNDGEGPLCVRSVKASCGCIKASLASESQRYEPGESGAIKIILKTEGRVGELNKRIEMLTNDVKRPRKHFMARVNICKGVLTKPSFLNFGRSALRATMKSHPLRIMSRPSEPAWEITKVVKLPDRPGQERTDYTFQVKEKDDDQWRSRYITVEAPAPMKKGVVKGRVEIHTTHPEHPVLSVRMNAYIVDRILIMNKRVALGYVRRGEATKPSPATRVHLYAASPAVTFKLLSASVEPKTGDPVDPRGTGFAVKTGRDRKGPFAEVIYDGTPFDPGLLEAQLVLKTDDPHQSEIRIPVLATLRE